jgi:hypothetical protein
MKKFLLKTIIFCGLTLAMCIPLAFLADGYTDSSYMKFTTPLQRSFILGTSRAATGIIPDILDSALSKAYDSLRMNNFAFTLLQTPYGEAYYQAVKKKLDPQTKGSVFIITVDPWSVSTFNNKYGDSATFTEESLAPGNMHLLNMQPNFEYLVKNYRDPYFKLIQNSLFRDSPYYLHSNGWFEVSIKFDSATVARRTATELDVYRNEYFHSSKLSATRLEYFGKMIELLKKHGDVYLVRMPVSSSIVNIENKLEPAFDSIVTRLSIETRSPYLNFKDSANNYTYSDGVHLDKKAAVKFTLQITKLIEAIRNDSAALRVR